MYSVGLAYFLWLISGFGALGFHRFYLGKIGSGLIYFVTGGLFGLGCIYDLITLPIQVSERNLQLRYDGAFGDSERRNTRNSGFAERFRDDIKREFGERKKDPLELVILKTARRNNGVVTPAVISLEAEVSLNEAQRALDVLVNKGFAELRSKRNGSLVYFFHDFADDVDNPDLEDL